METLIVLIVLGIVAGVIYFVFKGTGGNLDVKPAPAPGSQNEKRYWLLGTSGTVEGKNFHIGRRTASIGRGIGNHVQIGDENASRVHCHLSPTPYGLEIKDTGSSNGTLVNGEKITVYVLKDEDVVTIGEDVFTYREKGDFGEDAGLRGKSTAEIAGKSTVMEGGDFKGMLSNAIEQADGDTTKAAEAIGVNEDAFKEMLKKHGLS